MGRWSSLASAGCGWLYDPSWCGSVAMSFTPSHWRPRGKLHRRIDHGLMKQIEYLVFNHLNVEAWEGHGDSGLVEWRRVKGVKWEMVRANRRARGLNEPNQISWIFIFLWVYRLQNSVVQSEHDTLLKTIDMEQLRSVPMDWSQYRSVRVFLDS
jgi:hypothetical protein